MKVQNMTSSRGKKIANQFRLTGKQEVNQDGYHDRMADVEVFQSYESIIVERITDTSYRKCTPKCTGCHDFSRTTLDSTYWNYSVTTNKYRNQFLGETTEETQAKIDSGEYLLTDLNK